MIPSPPTSPPPSSDPQTEAVRAATSLRDEMREQFFAYDEIRQLPSSDRDVLFTILEQAQQGDLSILRDIYSLVYDELPVDMEEFICGRRYLGLKGRIDPAKLELLIEFDKPAVRKIWMAAGKGSGKSFAVSIMEARMIYTLLCLKRPDMFYMLGPGSKIAAVNLSVAKEQAKDVVYAEFIGRLSHSPWFAGKYKAQVGRCLFPKDVYAISGGSSAISFYGYHTILGAIDEVCFLLDREGRSLAEELTEALLGSLTTRFPNSYKLFEISTLRSDDDYLYREIERVKEHGEPIFLKTAM